MSSISIAEIKNQKSKIMEEDSLISEVETSLNSVLTGLPESEPAVFSIAGIGERARMTDPSAYSPVVARIGPIHWGNPELQPKSNALIKKLYGVRILSRNGELEINNCVRLLKSLTPSPRRYYSPEMIDPIHDEELFDMLYKDGCFIIELLLSAHEIRGRDQELWRQREADPILGNPTRLSRVKLDLLLFENQIPFPVLETVYNLAIRIGGDRCVSERRSMGIPSLPHLVMDFLDDLLPCNCSCSCSSLLNSKSPSVDFCHILHLFHWCVAEAATAPLPEKEEGDSGGFFQLQVIQPATKLQEHDRVKFSSKNDGSGLSMSFDQDSGVMDITKVRINGHTNSLLRNLIAFEQHMFHLVKPQVTAFTLLMGCLVESGADLDALREKQILDLPRFHDAELPFHQLFRMISNDTVVNYNFFYAETLGGLTTQVKKWSQRQPVVGNASLGRTSIAAAHLLIGVGLIYNFFYADTLGGLTAQVKKLLFPFPKHSAVVYQFLRERALRMIY